MKFQELLKQHGFIDSFREIHPNPVSHPGYTWPVAAQGTDGITKKTAWLKLADERDRIDFILYKSTAPKREDDACLRIRATDSWLVGTNVSVVRDEFVVESEMGKDSGTDEKDVQCNQDTSDYFGSPWPSDHRAVMTIFDIK